MDRVRVGINGYGTVGRRIADAVRKQNDMELVGVAKVSPDYKAFEAVSSGIPVYAVKGTAAFEAVNLPVKGSVKGMLKECDVVIDCSPKRCGKENADLYKKFPSLKTIFEGGEGDDIAGMSFNAQCNYDNALNKDAVRVVSCNTTALCRTLNQLNQLSRIKKARVAIARRTADPDDIKKGPINAWMPKLQFPSHHAEDVKTVLPDLKIVTLAGIAPMTLMHGHMLFVEFETPPSYYEVLGALRKNPRLWTIPAAYNLLSTAQIKEFLNTNGNTGNIYEACIWEEGIGNDSDGELGIHLAIDQQAIVVPENIDAIRAVFNLASAEKSMRMTEQSLGMGGKLLVKV